MEIWLVLLKQFITLEGSHRWFKNTNLRKYFLSYLVNVNKIYVYDGAELGEYIGEINLIISNFSMKKKDILPFVSKSPFKCVLWFSEPCYSYVA